MCYGIERVYAVYGGNELAHHKGLTLYFIDTVDFHIGELGLEVVGEHAAVELGYNHLAAEYLGGVGGQRADVA